MTAVPLDKPEECPVKKLKTYGQGSVNDLDLLEIAGIPKKIAAEVCIIGVAKVHKMSYEQLTKDHKIPSKYALRIVAFSQLLKRMNNDYRPTIDTPEAAYIHLMDLSGEKRECFKVLCLDGRRRLLASEVVSIGTATATLVHPREVFRFAIDCDACSVVVAHNHPSGDPTPSSDDRLLTERLHQAGRLLGINLDDHIVIGKGCFVSLRQLGVLCG